MIGGSLLSRNLRETLDRYRSLFVALGAGAVILLVVTAVAGSLVAKTARSLDSDSALTVLQLDSIDTRGPGTPLSGRSISEIEGMQGVQAVIPYTQFGVTVSDNKGSDLAGALWATPRIRWVQPALVDPGQSAVNKDLRGNEVLLPSTYQGGELKSLVGRELKVQYTRATGPSEGEGAEMTVRVVGIFDNSAPGQDGESAMYISDEVFTTLLTSQLGITGNSVPASYAYQSAYVKTASAADAATVQGKLVKRGFSAHNLATNARELPAVLGLLSKANLLIGLTLLLFCLGIGISLAGTWSALRRWDVGVLSSLGWSRARILQTYALEILGAGLLVGVVSAVSGTLLSLALGAALTGREILGGEFAAGAMIPGLEWVALVAAGIPLALVVGSGSRVWRLAALEPDVALRRID